MVIKVDSFIININGKILYYKDTQPLFHLIYSMSIILIKIEKWICKGFFTRSLYYHLFLSIRISIKAVSHFCFSLIVFRFSFSSSASFSSSSSNNNCRYH